jgi:DNA polymerase III epsilon subunit-like protein
MISVDVETSGTDPKVNSILSIGAVDMANPDNRFYGECRVWPMAVVEQEALNVNGFTMESCFDESKKTEGELIVEFVKWVQGTENNPLMCGQNVSFDRDFVKAACVRAGINSPFNYRVVDVHSIAWYYITIGGSLPPKNLSLNKCLEMVGAGREPEPHNALTGAMCSAEVISRMLNGKSLFPGEF